MGREIKKENSQTEKCPVDLLVSHFEIGKYYKHPNGDVMHIIGAVQTTLYGWSLLAEKHGSDNLNPVGQGTGDADNWTETTEEHWLSGFFGLTQINIKPYFL